MSTTDHDTEGCHTFFTWQNSCTWIPRSCCLVWMTTTDDSKTSFYIMVFLSQSESKMHWTEIHNAPNLHTIWGLSAFYFKSSPDKLGGTFSQVTWVRYAGFFWFPRFPSMPIYTFGPWFPEGLSLFLLKLRYPCISQLYYIYTVLCAIQTYK